LTISYLIRRYPTDEWYELIRCGRDEVSISPGRRMERRRRGGGAAVEAVEMDRK